MGSSDRENARFASTNQSLFRRNMKMFQARAQSDAITEGGIFAAAAGVIFLGAWLFAYGLRPAEKRLSPVCLVSAASLPRCESCKRCGAICSTTYRRQNASMK